MWLTLSSYGSSIACLLALSRDAIAADYHGSYFRLDAAGTPLTVDRIDPIMSPGSKVSNHIHNFYGSKGLSSDWTFDKAKAGGCNNLGPSKDHSNYWFPALYHHGSDGSYTWVPPKFAVYYHFDTADNGPRTMFPPGLKIIAGNAMLRHDDSATNKATKSIQWWCHDGDNKKTAGFPKDVTTCTGTNGFSAEIWFPFCWDGVNDFDPEDPFAHVIYGDGDRPEGGKCTGNHTMALPQLFMEFNHDVAGIGDKPGAEQPWVLSQGDPTGAGFHADFVNGWEDAAGSLSDAIKADNSNQYGTKCYAGFGGGGPASCLDMQTDDQKTGCTLAQSHPEEVKSPGKNLPGCNPIQAGPEDATIQTNCDGYEAPVINKEQQKNAGTPGMGSFDETVPSRASPAPMQPSKPVVVAGSAASSSTASSTGSGSFPPVTLTNGESWAYQGCYSDLTPNRNIRTLPEWGRGKTPSECADNCASAGFAIAGTEFGSQCFCGNALVMTQSKKIDDSECNTKCEGSSEICGGTGALSVYAKKGTNLGKRKRAHVRQHAFHRAHSP